MLLRLIDNFVTGLIVIAAAGVISASYNFIFAKAVDAHSRGLMSYKEYTEALWDKVK